MCDRAGVHRVAGGWYLGDGRGLVEAAADADALLRAGLQASLVLGTDLGHGQRHSQCEGGRGLAGCRGGAQ